MVYIVNLQSSNVAFLQCCYVRMLQISNVTKLLSCIVAMLWCCKVPFLQCTKVTKLQYCKIAMLKSYKVAKLQCRKVAKLQWCNGAMLQCCKVATLQHCHVAMLQTSKYIWKHKLGTDGRTNRQTDEGTGGLLELLSQLKIYQTKIAREISQICKSLNCRKQTI